LEAIFEIWLKGFGMFLEIILCKNKAKEYNGLLIDEMIIRSGNPACEFWAAHKLSVKSHRYT